MIDIEVHDTHQQVSNVKTEVTKITRSSLWFVVFISMAVETLLFVNITISIIDMVAPNDNSESYDKNVTNNIEIDAVNINQTCVEKNKFNWNEYEQGLVLGSYYWFYWLTTIPGGLLARKYGTKLVFGLAVLIGNLLCFLIPLAAHWDVRAVIFIRVIQGLVTGVCWPSIHHLTAHWIPPNERSKFITAYSGTSLPLVLFVPLFGYILSIASWEWTFHLCGIIGVLWYIMWQYMIYDTPAQHPRIDHAERDYIENSLRDGINNSSKTLAVPWMSIVTSRPVWMNVMAQFSVLWGIFTLIQQAPTYYKNVHGLDVTLSGLIAGLPHVLRIFVSLGFSAFCDYLLATKKMSRTNVRKLANSSACILHGLCILGMAYSVYNQKLSIVFFLIATIVNGTESSGSLASIVDLSPNYASVILGIVSMICVLPGFISPYIVGLLTIGNQSTAEQWRYVFLIAGLLLIVSGIIYVFLADSNLQPWNNLNETDNETREMKITVNNRSSNNDNGNNSQNHNEDIF